MSSTAEAKIGAIFLNVQQVFPVRMTLIEMVHLQLPTPIKTDNATSHRILTGNMCQKRSKAFDMQSNWMRYHIKQKQFRLYWQKGTENLAD